MGNQKVKIPRFNLRLTTIYHQMHQPSVSNVYAFSADIISVFILFLTMWTKSGPQIKNLYNLLIVKGIV